MKLAGYFLKLVFVVVATAAAAAGRIPEAAVEPGHRRGGKESFLCAPSLVEAAVAESVPEIEVISVS